MFRATHTITDMSATQYDTAGPLVETPLIQTNRGTKVFFVQQFALICSTSGVGSSTQRELFRSTVADSEKNECIP